MYINKKNEIPSENIMFLTDVIFETFWLSDSFVLSKPFYLGNGNCVRPLEKFFTIRLFKLTVHWQVYFDYDSHSPGLIYKTLLQRKVLVHKTKKLYFLFFSFSRKSIHHVN